MKNILKKSWALAITLALALPAAADHVHCVCGDGACTAAGHTHAAVAWQEWTSTTTLPTTAGNWYLANDVTLTAECKPATGVNLCLNGHDVRISGNSNFVYLNANVAFAVTDCGTTVRYATDPNGDGAYETIVTSEPASGAYFPITGGAFVGGSNGTGGTIYLFGSGSSFALYRGNIVGHNCTHIGGAVGVNNGTFNMYGGLIGGCRAATRNAALHNWYGSANVYGGTFCNNVGAIYSENSNVKVYGGLFTRHTGTVITSWINVNVYGGDITGNATSGSALMDASGTIDLQDCFITNNTLTKAGAAAVVNPATIGGGVVVKGNVNTADSCERNLYLASGKTTTIAKALATGAQIGVTTQTAPTAGTPVAVTSNRGEDYTYFTSDAGYDVMNVGGAVKLALPPVAAVISGATTNQFTTVADAVTAANASTTDCEIQMLTSCANSGNLIISNANGKVITLNTGNAGTNLTITATTSGQYLIDVRTQLILKGNGGRITANLGGKAGTVLYAGTSTAVVKMYDGVEINTINGTGDPRVLVAKYYGKCYIYGGKFLCPKAGETGVNTRLSTIVCWTNGSIYIYGGEFHWDVSGTVDYWAGVLDSADAKEFKIYGGYFDGPLWWSGSASAQKYIFYGGKYTTNKLKKNASAKEGTQDWTSYLGDGRYVNNITETYNGTTYYYEIKYDAVAQNVRTATKYVSIKEALDEVQPGDTVKLLRDIKENVSITTTMSNTFDLAGNVLKGTAGSSVVSVVGDLTIIDSVGTGAITTGGATGNAYAGGIYTSGRLTLLGGAVTNCVGSSRAGGVYVSAGTFTVGGTAKVYGNFVNGKPNNVYLLKGKKMVVSTTTPLASGVKIGVTTEAVPTATSWVPVTDTNDGDYSQNFSSDAGYVVVNDANVVKLAAFAAKLTPYDGTERPTSGQFTYDVKTSYKYVTQYGTYKGVLIVEGGVSNYYYETLQMAIAAAKAGAVNTGYCSDANPNGCFKEGTPYDYANNDSLNPNLGKYTDTVTLCANATMIVNRGSGDSPTANYGVRKGIIIDMNGYSVTGTPGYFGLAAGEIPAGQVLVYCNGTALASAYDQDIFDDEGGTGYRAGEIVFANMNMRGQIWPANHSFVFLNGTYDIKLGHTEASPENPKNLQLRGGYYMRDPTVYKIDYTDCHVELASKDPTIEPYFCRVVKGGTQMKITFMANRTDATLGGEPFVSTNKWITYGRVADIPRPEVEGLAVIGWSKTEGAKEVQYTFEQVATLSTEHGSEFTLYAVWGTEVRIPVFVALDGLGVVPQDGRTYEFSITNGSATTPLQPCCTNLVLACPAGTGDVYRVGFATNDVSNPWTLSLGEGTYIYDIRQKTVARPGEQLAEGTWRTCIKVDFSAKPYVTLTNNEYLDAIDDLSEGAFKSFKNSGEASFSSVERYIILGSDTQTVVWYGAFNRALVKSKFAFDFSRSFRVDGTMQVGNAADGTAIGFVPNGQDLNTSSDFSGEGSALGAYQCSKNGNGLFLEFDTLGDGYGWGGQTDYIGNTAHFVLTTTDKNGNPSNVKGQNVVFGANYALPSEVMGYSIDYDSFSKEMLFTIKTTTQTWKLAYTNPPAVFGGMKAYMTLSGAMRYGGEYEYGCGEEGSPAPKTKITIATFNYVNDAMTGAVENTFRNRQEALVTYNAWGGEIVPGEETTQAFANVARYDTPVDPERAGGYTFDGWYTSWTNGAAKVVRGTRLDPIADCTVYAKWISPSTPAGEGEKVIDFEPVATNADGSAVIGAGAVLKGATNELENTDLAIPEFTSNGSEGVPYVIIKADSFSYNNYDAKRVEAGEPEKRLSSVTVSTYVTNIQSYAFAECKALTNVTFSKTRDYTTGEKAKLVIEDWAFKYSTVKSIVFPADSCVELDYGSFAHAEQLEDIYILGDVKVKSRYPFLGAGSERYKTTGEPVKVHLSAKLAADAEFVASLTNGMSAARVVLDQQIEGRVDLVGEPTITSDPMVFNFTVSDDSPWLKVTTDTVYLFYSTTLKAGPYIGNTPLYATEVTTNADGSYTAKFAKPAGASSMFFQLCVGEER